MNYLASEIETGKESRIREAITMLNGIPRANLPQQLADVVEKHIATEVGLSVINSHQGISVWQRAAGKEFPTSFVRALSRLDGEQKKILLSSFPLVLQGLQCSEPAELEPLLEWCDTLCRLSQRPLRRLVLVSDFDACLFDIEYAGSEHPMSTTGSGAARELFFSY